MKANEFSGVKNGEKPLDNLVSGGGFAFRGENTRRWTDLRETKKRVSATNILDLFRAKCYNMLDYSRRHD